LRLSNRKWRERFGRYISELQELGERTDFSVTHWFFWRATQDSSLQPPEKEILGRVIYINYFSSF